LADKRQELGFLLQIMDLNPEMVAVVLHQAFQFTVPAVMDQFVTRHEDELLAWKVLKHSLNLEPWAQPIVDQILQEPMGEWLLSVAAALEYIHTYTLSAANLPPEAEKDDEAENDEAAHRATDEDGGARIEDDDDQDARSREEAGNDWLAEQGFDRKD
jgi:hypothetical protein